MIRMVALSDLRLQQLLTAFQGLFMQNVDKTPRRLKEQNNDNAKLPSLNDHIETR